MGDMDPTWILKRVIAVVNWFTESPPECRHLFNSLIFLCFSISIRVFCCYCFQHFHTFSKLACWTIKQTIKISDNDVNVKCPLQLKTLKDKALNKMNRFYNILLILTPLMIDPGISSGVDVILTVGNSISLLLASLFWWSNTLLRSIREVLFLYQCYSKKFF